MLVWGAELAVRAFVFRTLGSGRVACVAVRFVGECVPSSSCTMAGLVGSRPLFELCGFVSPGSVHFLIRLDLFALFAAPCSPFLEQFGAPWTTDPHIFDFLSGIRLNSLPAPRPLPLLPSHFAPPHCRSARVFLLAARSR